MGMASSSTTPISLQLEEERLHAIDRENRLLLERVARILRTKGSLAGDMTRSWGACPAYMAPMYARAPATPWSIPSHRPGSHGRDHTGSTHVPTHPGTRSCGCPSKEGVAAPCPAPGP